MAELTPEDKQSLLELARTAIAARLVGGHSVKRPETPSKTLGEKRGCFVSLHQKGQLRGCIGTLEATHPLLDGVEENAKNAAFCDPRFSPLTKEELDGVNIEISILTEPRVLHFSDADDLQRQLIPGVHGLILSRGGRRATFLPQVWDQLPDKTHFLEHLCRKAGMGPDCWKDEETTVAVYEVVHFSE
jgi:AmmeMemoRadiSam system protein A